MPNIMRRNWALHKKEEAICGEMPCARACLYDVFSFMFEYCSAKVRRRASAHRKSAIKYKEKIAAQLMACSCPHQAISAKIMKPKQEALLSEIVLFAGGQVVIIIAKNAAEIIIAKMLKKSGIAPANPKHEMPMAMAADCMPSVAPPLFA